MGNQLAAPQKLGAGDVGAELPVVVKDALGGGRFIKTLLCVHDAGGGGLVVVKAYHKRGDGTPLAPYGRALRETRARLWGVDKSHVWPPQAWREGASAAYVARQHFWASLYDRLGTRPFMTAVEKRWAAYQLLAALAQAHARGVCHGDVKCENLMMTSWGWLYLADWAPYKPTYLPADNPADFSFFFDTGGRRRCYLAPERFYEGRAAGAGAAIDAAAPLTPEMDVFAAGCVIAEMLLDGRALFDLGQLLAHRRGDGRRAAEALAGAADPQLAALAAHMIQLNPGDRWGAAQYLEHWPAAQELWPPFLTEGLEPFLHGLHRLGPDERVAAAAAGFADLQRRALGGGGSGGDPAAGRTAAAAAAAGPAVAAQPPQQQQQLPSPPGAGAGLLDDVSALLSGTAALRSRLAAAPTAEDDGICLDGDDGPAGGDAAAVAGSSSTASASVPPRVTPGVGEVVVERWWEYETRAGGTDGAWAGSGSGSGGEGSSTGNDGGGGGGAGAGAAGPVARKEDVHLPGGWVWDGGWAVDSRSGGTGADGWEYCRAPDAAAGDGAAAQQRGWGGECLGDSARRRRCWTRRRRRQLTLGSGTSFSSPAPAPGPAAVAAAAAVTAAAGLSSGGGAAAGDGAGRSASRASGGGGAAPPCEGGMVLVVNALCALLRGCTLLESKRACILLLTDAALMCDDDTRLQRAVPYLVTQLGDASTVARSLALRCLVRLVSSVEHLPPGDAKVYHDYLLPSLSLLPHDPEEAVRVEYGIAVAHLAASAHWHLVALQFGGAAAAAAAGDGSGGGCVGGSGGGGGGGGGAAGGAGAGAPVRFDAEIAAVRGAVERTLLDLITGGRSTPDIQRALLAHAAALARFFGRRDINDVLLPLLITCLNAASWQLRGSFFGAIAGIGPYGGRDSLDVFLPPCLEQALGDREPAVVADAVVCAAAVAGHLRKRNLLAAAKKIAPLLQHPASAVRRAAVDFVAAAARALPLADTYTQLRALVMLHLAAPPLVLDDEEHVASLLRAPVEATRADNSAGLVPPPPLLGLYNNAPGASEGPMLLTPAAPVYSMELDAAVVGRAASAGNPSSYGYRPDGFCGSSSGSGGDTPAARRPATTEGGLRARPCSAHTAAVETLGVRLMALEERRAALAERLACGLGGETGDEPSERAVLDRIAATINRLRRPAGTDAREPSALMTHKMLALASRGSPGLQAFAPGAGVDGAAQGSAGVTAAVSAALSSAVGDGPGCVSSGGPAAAVAAAAGASGAPWRPRGVLVSHLAEHRRAVNRLALTGNGQLLLSASDDETVKVWDVRRLERDVSFRSRLTYAGQTGPIMAVSGAEDGQSAASASASGSLHVWRVEYTTRAGGAPDKFTGITARRQVSPGEGRVFDVQAWGGSPFLLTYVTQRGGVHGLDLRSCRDVWVVPSPPSLGLLTSVAADPVGQNWLLLGSSRGHLRLWDVRFLLRASSCQHPTSCPIGALAVATAPPSRLGLAAGVDPVPGAALVYAAAGDGEISLWDMASCSCIQVLRTAPVAGEAAAPGSAADIPAALKPLPEPRLGPSSAAADQPPVSSAAAGEAGGAPGVDAGDTIEDALRAELSLNDLDMPQQARPHHAPAVLPLGGGQLFSGGADRALRCWDPARPDRSYVIAGPVWPGGIIDPATNLLNPPATAQQYRARRVGAASVIEELPSVHSGPQTRLDAAPDLASRMRMQDACHADSITALLAAEAAHGRLLLSASRDGVVKAWK